MYTGRVHNVMEAMSIFPEIQFVEPEEQERPRRNLLAYCRLDTLAMVSDIAIDNF